MAARPLVLCSGDVVVLAVVLAAGATEKLQKLGEDRRRAQDERVALPDRDDGRGRQAARETILAFLRDGS